MNSREKKIFCAGISVGTQLKGWASVGGSGGNSGSETTRVLLPRPVKVLAVNIGRVAVAQYRCPVPVFEITEVTS